MLSAAGSTAVLFNGIKESWRLARKILSQFKLLRFLNVFGNTTLAILHLEIAKNLFAAGSAEQLNSPLVLWRASVTAVAACHYVRSLARPPFSKIVPGNPGVQGMLVF